MGYIISMSLKFITGLYMFCKTVSQDETRTGRHANCHSFSNVISFKLLYTFFEQQPNNKKTMQIKHTHFHLNFGLLFFFFVETFKLMPIQFVLCLERVL